MKPLSRICLSLAGLTAQAAPAHMVRRSHTHQEYTANDFGSDAGSVWLYPHYTF